jgi:hypothetical protein
MMKEFWEINDFESYLQYNLSLIENLAFLYSKEVIVVVQLKRCFLLINPQKFILLSDRVRYYYINQNV